MFKGLIKAKTAAALKIEPEKVIIDDAIIESGGTAVFFRTDAPDYRHGVIFINNGDEFLSGAGTFNSMPLT